MRPPKPRLVLRLGVTGHRPNRMSDDAFARVTQGLTQLFGQIEDVLLRVHGANGRSFNDDAPQVRLVSALAEGADRHAAQAALGTGFALDVTLPFAPEIYEKDFATLQSREQFRALLARARTTFVLPGAVSAADPAVADRAYEAVGLMTLRQCDILIGIWDGKPASGRGGTEQIIQRAVLSRIPVLWFDADGAGPWLLLDDARGSSDAIDLGERVRQSGPQDQAIMALVHDLVVPPGGQWQGPDVQSGSMAQARKLLARYLDEGQYRSLLTAFSYPLMLAVIARKWRFWRPLFPKPYLPATDAEWRDYWHALKGAAPMTPLHEILMQRYAWADKLANHYGLRHRSRYVGNFVLSAVAVTCAVLSHYMGFGRPLIFVELVIIAAVWTTTMLGNRREWHQRWLDYRQLCEQLRHLRMLWLTGSSIEEIRYRHLSDTQQPGPIWTAWYYRATCRELGMPDVTVDERYVKAAQTAISRGEIGSQLGYHRSNAVTMGRAATVLKVVGEGSFLMTGAICVLELVFHLDLAWLSAISVMLPAFGAAAFGIRVQGEFEASSERSKDMEKRLDRIQSRLTAAEAMSFAELSSLAEEAAATMTSELGDFRFIYSGRPLALPA